MTNIDREKLYRSIGNDIRYALEFEILCEPEQNGSGYEAQYYRSKTGFVIIKPRADFGDTLIAVSGKSEAEKEFCLKKILSSVNGDDIYIRDYDNILKDDFIQELKKSSFGYKIRTNSCISYFCMAVTEPQNSGFMLRKLKPEDKDLIIPENDDDYIDNIFVDLVTAGLHKYSGILGAFDGEALAGYIGYYCLGYNVSDASYIYVREAYRRKGIGKLLLSEFVRHNLENGYTSFYSYSDGTESEKLAISCGFKALPVRFEHFLDFHS